MGGVCVEDIDDRKAIFHAQRHEQARHDRKMKRHVAFISFALAEICDGIFRPLVRFGEEASGRRYFSST